MLCWLCCDTEVIVLGCERQDIFDFVRSKSSDVLENINDETFKRVKKTGDKFQ